MNLNIVYFFFLMCCTNENVSNFYLFQIFLALTPLKVVLFLYPFLEKIHHFRKCSFKITSKFLQVCTAFPIALVFVLNTAIFLIILYLLINDKNIHLSLLSGPESSDSYQRFFLFTFDIFKVLSHHG